jgi:hypothetical protein
MSIQALQKLRGLVTREYVKSSLKVPSALEELHIDLEQKLGNINLTEGTYLVPYHLILKTE